MKRIFILMLLIILTCFNIDCSFMSTGLKEPENNKTIIVVGSISIDLFQYLNMTKTYRSGVKVIIAGRHKKNGSYVYKNYWVETDTRGYFYLENVPDGDYALRGFRFETVGPSYFLTVISPLQNKDDKFQVSRAVKIPDKTFVFNYPVQNRIANLWHNYFLIDRGQEVHPKVYFQYNNFRLVTGKTLMEPNVISYFTEKFPQSSWFKEN